MKPIPTLVAFVVLLAPLQIGAQRQMIARVGDRIRVSAPESGYETIVGDLVASDSTQLRIHVRGVRVAYRVTRNQIENLEVSIARHRHTGSGMALGAANGALLGLSFGTKRNPNNAAGEAEDMGGPAPRSALLGAAVGAFVGGTIGYLARTDVWEAVPSHEGLHPAAAYSADRLSFGFTIRR
jgi:hypothetical protein